MPYFLKWNSMWFDSREITVYRAQELMKNKKGSLEFLIQGKCGNAIPFQ